MEKVRVHALLHTNTCNEIIEPAFRGLLREDLIDVELSATVIRFARTDAFVSDPMLREVEVNTDAEAVPRILASMKSRSAVLLSVADWTHPAHRPGHQATEEARALGVPSLSLQHGIYRMLDDGRVLHNDFTSDFAGVWGPWFKHQLVRSGKGSDEQILVLGNPRLDEVRFTQAKADELVRRHWGLSRNERVALMALSTHQYASEPRFAQRWPNERVIELLRMVMQGLVQGGIDVVVVRPHPADLMMGQVGLYEEAVRRSGVRILMSDYHDVSQPGLFEILQSVDVVLVQESTVGLYGVYFGAPVVTIGYPGEVEVYGHPYVDGMHYLGADCRYEEVAQFVGTVVQTAPTRSERGATRASYVGRYFAEGPTSRRMSEAVRAIARSAS